METQTYLIVDGENIDATLGMSLLNRRPDSDERPRWDRVLSYSRSLWEGSSTIGLFFLNASSGSLPMNFVQALLAMDYRPVPLSGRDDEKVVDVGIQHTLEAILKLPSGNVILASHDGDFVEQVEKLLDAGRRVGVICFQELLSGDLRALEEKGLQIIDLEYEVHAFTVPLPRIGIIDLTDFDPNQYLK